MPKVKFYGPLTRFTRGEKEVDAEGTTLHELLARLFDRYGPELQGRILSADRVNTRIRILVNGQSIQYLEELDAPVKQGDEIIIMPAVAGG